MRKTNLMKSLLLSIAWLYSSSQAIAQLGEQAKLFTNNSEVWETNNHRDLQLTDNLTLSALIYLNKTQISGTPIISKYQANGSGGYMLGFASNNKLQMYVGAEEITSELAVPIGKWVEVKGVFNRDKNTFNLYIDNQIVASATDKKFSPAITTNYPLRIASNEDGFLKFNGLIKNIKIQGDDKNLADWTFNANQEENISQTPSKYRLAPTKAISGKNLINTADDILWYNSPANLWVEALPVGNGRLGAMVFGRPERERLQLNDVTVWSGDPQPDADRKDAYKHLPEVRKAIRDRKFDLAEKLTNQYMTSPAPYEASYQTLGDLLFQFDLPKGNVENYHRSLDIANAVSNTSFSIDGISFDREVFSTATDNGLVTRIKASKAGQVSFNLNLDRLEKSSTKTEGNDMLVMRGNTGNTLTYEVQVKVKTVGGTVKAVDGELVISGADEAIVFLTASTSYILDYKKGYKGKDPHQEVSKWMANLSAQPYEQLKQKHIQDYKQYFDRVQLDLGKTESSYLPTNIRLSEYKDGVADPALAELFYQFGRYLLISSSRPNNPLPSNSQGLWGDGLTLPWMCDYKSNINYEMNYWPAEQSNLSELHLPMLRKTQSLIEPGKKTAKAYFGPKTPGWFYGYTTNGWGWTSPGASLPWGVFMGGSGWTCQHLWEHYAFTRDKDYLKSVYPTMKGAAEFYLATLIEDENGYLITSPSTSPENYFRTDEGISASVSEGNTMERAIIWDLFNNLYQATQVLNTDKAFGKKVLAARDKIRPLEIGRHGQLLEWGEDWDNPNDHHRHVSHLFALHPGRQILATTTPELAAAARQSLELRTDVGTGWSKAWKINFWTRLRDGDRAHKLLNTQLTYVDGSGYNMVDGGGTYPNLFDAHPPFQIDGNYGAVAGITEMLVQSMENYELDKYIVDILPALPSAWPKGSIKGARARGGFELDIAWNEGKLQEAKLTSLNGEECIIRTNCLITIDGQQVDQVKKNDYYETKLETNKNKTYIVRSL